MSDSQQTRAWQLMKKLDFCMLVTHASGGLHARPMSSIVKPDVGKIYFLSDVRSAKDEEIASNPDVLLAYGNGSSQFVSTSAQASISNDRGLIRELWNPGAQAFWPNGPEDPNVIAIVATPVRAEYWEGSALSSVKFVFAMLTGTKPDMGENAKVRL
jgi:general stress protein 26